MILSIILGIVISMNDQKESFKWDKKKVLALVILCLTISGLVLFAQWKGNQIDLAVSPERAGFVISTWSETDEYGQSLHQFEVFGNSTGDWVQVGPPYGGVYEDWDPIILDWEVGVAIKLRVYTWFNSTLTGAGSLAEGKLLQRHSVNVTDSFDVSVFSQQNFTYYDATDAIAPPMWFYVYDVVLNFIPSSGMIYTVTIIYEVYW